MIESGLSPLCVFLFSRVSICFFLLFLYLLCVLLFGKVGMGRMTRRWRRGEERGVDERRP